MVPKYFTLLRQKITEYITDWATQKKMIATLTEETNRLKKEVSREKSRTKRLKKEKQHFMFAKNSLKDNRNCFQQKNDG